MIRRRRRSDDSSVTVLFTDKASKTLFLQTMEEYNIPLENLMKTISPAIGLGATEPSVTIDREANTITVEATISDKGTVLSKNGYDKYSDVRPGDRYAAIQEGKLCLFEKVETKEDGSKNADIAIGYAPSITEIYDSLNKDGDIDIDNVRKLK